MRLLWIAPVLACAVALGCLSDSQAPKAVVLGNQAAAAEKQKSADGWGTIKGKVVWGGDEIPAPEKIDVTQNKEHCLEKGPLFRDDLVINKKNKGVRYAIVWLATESPTDKLPVHPDLEGLKKKPVVMDQPRCMFEPHALAMEEGQTLVVKNSAPVAHNVNWQGVLNGGGNQTVPPGSKHEITDLVADKLPLLVKCNIHPWMSARLGVFKHPYFSVSDKDGNFEIKLAPAGTYRLVVWHEKVGYVTPNARKGIKITIDDGKTTAVEPLKLKPKS